MNKKWLWLIIIPIILLIICVIGFIYYRSQASLLNTDMTDSSITIIGGADGPTSVFLTGKIGGSDIPDELNVEEVDMEQIEIQIGDQSMIAL